MKNLVFVVLVTFTTVYGDPGVPNIIPAYAVSPLHHTVPPAKITYNPSAAAKAYEHEEPLLKYTRPPLAVKAPLATSYATTTSVHVTHEVPEVAVHEPIFKYTEPVYKHSSLPELKFATEPAVEAIYKYAAAAPVIKFASESVAEPIYTYAASAPIVKFAAESLPEPSYKYAELSPVVKYASEPIATDVFKNYEVSEPIFKYSATPIIEHEGHSFDYAPSYAHGLKPLSSYH